MCQISFYALIFILRNLTSISDYSRSTENLHVKTNKVHTLHRIKATGLQPLESFKDILTPEEYSKCESNPMRGKTWYPLAANVFVAFLFRVWSSNKSDILMIVISTVHLSTDAIAVSFNTARNL